MTSEISVIICSYTEKRRDNLVAAVESVQQQTLRLKDNKRAWAILAGLTVTTVGYIAGKTIPIQQSRKK